MEISSRKRKRTKLIDIEWAKSLKGLSMQVPDNWWMDYNSRIVLDSFDRSTQKWSFLIDSNPIHHGLQQ